jgi:signal transduction histidine kinase
MNDRAASRAAPGGARGATPRRPIAAALGLFLASPAIASGGVAAAAPLPDAALPRGRNAIVLYQDTPNIPFIYALNEGLRRALRDVDGLTVYTEHLDLSRFPDPGYADGLRGWLRAKYAAVPVDVVLAAGPPAAAFATRPEPLWPGVPVIFFAVDERAADDLASVPGVTGLVHRSPIGETLELALRLLPDARRLAIIGGAAPTDRIWEGPLREEAAKLAGRVEVVELLGLPVPELTERLAALPRGTPIVGVSFLRDGAGRTWTGPELFSALEPSAPGPVFSVWDFLVGRGGAGGVVLDVGRLGEEAGRVARRILEGEAPGAVPVRRTGDPHPLLDGRILARWGIPGSRVPPDAEVLFRPRPAWVEYPRTALAIAAALLVQGALIAWLFLERRRRRLAEHAAGESQAAVAHSNRVASLGELAASLAHEINTPLASIVVSASSMRRLLGARPAPGDAELRESLSVIESEGRRAGEVIRRMRAVLRREPSTSGPVDLADVAREALALVQPRARQKGVEMTLEATPGLPPVEGDRVQLLQVALNLLLNALDAVAALPPERRRVAVGVSPDGDAVGLLVADAGEGLAPAARARLFEPFFTTKPAGLGMGLPIARSIVEAHGGRIWLEDAPAGAVLRVRLPAGRAVAAAARAVAP